MASNMFNFRNARAGMNSATYAPPPSKPVSKTKKQPRLTQPFSKYTGDITGNEMVSLFGRSAKAILPNHYLGDLGDVFADYGDMNKAERLKKEDETRKQDRLIELAKLKHTAAMDRTVVGEEGADRRSGNRIAGEDKRAGMRIDGLSDAATVKSGREITSAEKQHGYNLAEIEAKGKESVKLAGIKDKKKAEKDILEYVDKGMKSWYEGRGFDAPEPTPQEIETKRAELRARRTMENEGKRPAFYNGELIYVDKEGNAFDRFGKPISAQQQQPNINLGPGGPQSVINGSQVAPVVPGQGGGRSGYVPMGPMM